MESSTFLTPQRIGIEDFGSPHSYHEKVGHDSRFLSPGDEKHDYNFSGHYDDSSAQSAVEETTDDEIARLNGTSDSSRSSISSLPASVAASAFVQPPDAITPTKSLIEGQDSLRNSINVTKSPTRIGERQHSSPFRHASSVRAMRDDDTYSFSNRRRDSQMTGRMSTYSGRSSHTSSPTKRRTRGSPQKESQLKKEYPLVLLHCTLLPPTIALPSASTYPELLEEVLPNEYWRKWKLLNDKITGSSEVRSRGVLIPHPKGDYGLLEERLLESLELARPRIRSDHFLGNEDVASDSDESDDESPVQGVPCPDCGRTIVKDDEDKTWDIKVYAANGLMKAGAWSAAWSEMEKIDIEVGVWLPDEVRREAELSLQDLLPTFREERAHIDSRDQEVYGAGDQATQEDIDGLNDMPVDPPTANWVPDLDTRQPPPQGHVQETLSELFSAYLKRIMDDRKNALIIFLSIMVVWFAMTTTGAKPQPPQIMVPEAAISIASQKPVIATSVITTTATATAVMTSTATTTTTTTIVAEVPAGTPEVNPVMASMGMVGEEDMMEALD